MTRFILKTLPLFTLAVTACTATSTDDTASSNAAKGDADTNPETDTADTQTDEEDPSPEGQVWTANRAGGNVSIIDVARDEVVQTIALPNGADPMYVNYSAGQDVVFVGDRGSSEVHVFDASSAELVTSIEVGEGIFHQWALRDGAQLWVNADVDRTTTVIDTGSYEVLAVIDMPADLAGMAGSPIPHDVLVSPDEDAAFVTYLGFEGDVDYIVRFDATTFEETHRFEAGKDPHVSATPSNGLLYIACQGTSEVIVVDRQDLQEVDRISIPGAHGVGMSNTNDLLYVGNLPGGGDMALFTLDTAINSLTSSEGVDAPAIGAPHNLALSGDDTKLYVTHSGPMSTLVSVYEVDATGALRGPTAELEVGANPFGLGFVPPRGG